uniref:Uncharacterized protein n=1 Tax=Strigamia maritima TaxID=126957 RepID=T1IMF4_STRMM
MMSMATSDLLDVGNIIFKAYEGGSVAANINGTVQQLQNRPILFAQLYAFSFNFVMACFAYSMTGVLSKRNPKFREYEVYLKDVDSVKKLSPGGYALYLRDAFDVFGHHSMSNVWSCTFFLMLFLKTFCSTLCTYECIIVSIYDFIPFWRNYQIKFRLLVALTGFASKIKRRQLYDLKLMVGWHEKFYVYLQLVYYIALPILTLMYVIFGITSISFPVHIFTAVLVAFLLVAAPITILGYAIYEIWKHKKRRLPSAFHPTRHWLAQPILSKETAIINYPTNSWRYKFYYFLQKLGFNYNY